MDIPTSDEKGESKVRLDAALGLLVLSSAWLKDVTFSGPDDVVDFARAELRFARMRFLAARADYHEEPFS